MKITLKAARINAGYKQSEVCKVLDITRATLINYEKGRYSPRFETLKKLATLYKVDINSLNTDIK